MINSPLSAHATRIYVPVLFYCKRDGRDVTNVGWNEMDVAVRLDYRWAVLSLRDVFREAMVTDKVMHTRASAEEPVNTIAQGRPVMRLIL